MTKDKSEMSEEHVFPEAIGGVFIIRQICKPCNSYLGHHVDHALCNDWYICLTRTRLGIGGKKDKIRPEVSQALMPDGRKIRVEMNPDTRKVEPYLLRHIEQDPITKEIRVQADPRDANKIPDMINKRLKDSGFPEMAPSDILARIKHNYSPKITVHPLGMTKHPNIQQALIKIMYEMTWYWLGDSYLDDEIGETLRRFILDRTVAPGWEKDYKFPGGYNRIKPPDKPFYHAHPDGHMARIQHQEGGIFCYVRVFSDYEMWTRVCDHSKGYSLDRPRTLFTDTQTRKITEEYGMW